jgi:hypothetical protein
MDPKQANKPEPTKAPEPAKAAQETPVAVATAEPVKVPETFDRPDRDEAADADFADDRRSTPAEQSAAMEEYRQAYRYLADADPDAIKAFPHPDRPGQNFDAVTVLKQLRKVRGSLRTLPGDDIRAGATGDRAAAASRRTR